MKFFIKFIATILIVVGAWLSVIGYSYRAEEASHREFAVPMSQPLVNIARNLPAATKDSFLFSQYGLLPLFGGIGGVLIFISVLLSNIANREKKSILSELSKKDTRIKLPSSAQGAETVSAPNSDVVADNTEEENFANDDSSMPNQSEGLSDDIKTYGNFEDLLDINTLVSLSQSHLGQEECQRIMQMFRPDLLEHKEILSEESLHEITKRILESVILRHRRQEKDITSDQFRIQDRRLSEIEKGTVVRRYFPRDKDISPEAKKHVGKVYDFNMQSEIQQNYLSEADDWIDISLRNAKQVLSMSIDEDSSS